MMRINIIIRFLSIILLVGLVSCVKEFEPDLEDSATHKIVISGQLTDVEGFQMVDVTITSSLHKPSRIPLTNCILHLVCSDGKTWAYSEESDGVYQVWLNENELDYNKEYHLELITPNNERIVSMPEKFYSCPDVDEVYYKRDSIKSKFNGQVYLGLQFLLDLKAKDSDSRYFLFDVVETSEFHAPLPIEWWYDGVIHQEVPPDYSKSLCWNTQTINDVFVLATDNLASNEYVGHKLNFTDNHSQRLQHLYSINVKQYSITNNAYIYWNQMRTNMHQDGGLYNNQPFAIKGNFKNETNTDQEVLGFFFVSRVKEKRIFIPPQGFFIVDNSCGAPTELRFGLRDISPIQYPAYLVSTPTGYANSLLDKGCVDCTSDGGTTTKPDFWP